MDEHDVSSRLAEFLFPVLEETFERVHGIFLDQGTSLFETLAAVRSAAASAG